MKTTHFCYCFKEKKCIILRREKNTSGNKEIKRITFYAENCKESRTKDFFFFRKGDWDLHIYKCKQNSHSKPQKMTQNIRKPLSLPPSLKGKKKIEIFITFSKLLKWQRILRPPLYKIKCFPTGLVEFKLKCMKQRIIKYKLPFLGLPVHPRVGSNMLQWKVLHEVTLLFNIGSIILYNKQTQN